MPRTGFVSRVAASVRRRPVGLVRRRRLACFSALGVLFLPAAAGAGAVPRHIAGSHSHTCVVTATGGVRCMGRNHRGQLGDGTTIHRYTAVDVVGLSQVVAVATGEEHTCAVTDDGSVMCWGANTSGQLGNGTYTDEWMPVRAALAGAVAVAAGMSHSCAVLGSGTAYCWGLNNFGLGDPTIVASPIPVAVSGLTGATTIVSGSFHTCAGTADGVKCWGRNAEGQLGDGSPMSGSARQTPVSVSGLVERPIALSAQANQTCAVTAGGGAKCWGENGSSQLGDGTTMNRNTPVDVVGLSSGVAAIGAGSQHTCALTTTGGVKCWGSNYNGQVGAQLPRGTVSSPTSVSTLTTGVVRLGAGWEHTCAATVGGALKCWGWNSEGELGDGTVPERPTPVDTLPAGSGATLVSATQAHTCAVTTGGGVKCWGGNASGQLGDGTNEFRNLPVDVVGLGAGVAAPAAGNTHSCALATGGGVVCWGDNDYGQLGTAAADDSWTPVPVIGLPASMTAVATGSGHTCGLTAEGGMLCWGRNDHGQLGDGTTTDRIAPVGVSGLSSGVAAIDLGDAHTCAVLGSGALECWGDNGLGQLGDGTTTDRWVPTGVSGLDSGVTNVGAGDAHTCAVRSTGEVLCWGAGGSGRLGNGAGMNQPTPVSVIGLTNGVSVTAGHEHTCAITTSGGVQCWGNNYQGQLGDGSWMDISIPIPVSGLSTGARGVVAGYSHTCAVTTAGGVKCWGDNAALQLGDGSWTVRTAPVFVEGYDYPSITAVAPVSAAAGSGDVALTVYGLDFGPGSRVLFGDIERPATRVSDGQLVAFIPAADLAAAGLRTVRVVNPSNRSSNILLFQVRSGGSADAKDFNSDGQADILWESNDGWVAAWLMNGTAQAQNLLLYNYPVAVDGWHVAGTGDFNGDGQSDILWQSDAGYVAAWLMNGTRQVANQLLYDYPVAVGGWHIVAAGDLDGDSISDLLWQDHLGYVAYWLMGVDYNGRVFQRTNALLHPQPVAAGGWLIVGSGDLNGDTTTDLVWQSPDGYVAAWIMSGVSQVANTLLYDYAVATDGWTVVGTADMNGDGMVDILWQQRPLSPADMTRGYLATWLMNGIRHAGTTPLTPPRVEDPAWKIVGPK